MANRESSHGRGVPSTGLRSVKDCRHPLGLARINTWWMAGKIAMRKWWNVLGGLALDSIEWASVIATLWYLVLIVVDLICWARGGLIAATMICDSRLTSGSQVGISSVNYETSDVGPKTVQPHTLLAASTPGDPSRAHKNNMVSPPNVIPYLRLGYWRLCYKFVLTHHFWFFPGRWEHSRTLWDESVIMRPRSGSCLRPRLFISHTEAKTYQNGRFLSYHI